MFAAVTFQATDLWPVSLAVAALVAAAVFYLYPPQVRLLPMRWRWLLPALRATALAALMLSILRPVVILTKTAPEQGAVVILLDGSMSMGVRDRMPPPDAPDRAVVGQLVALADALGRLGPNARSPVGAGLTSELNRLETLGEDVERAYNELEYARLQARPTDEPSNRLRRTVEAFVAAAAAAEQHAIAINARSSLVNRLAGLARAPAAPNRDWLRRIRREVGSAFADAQRSQDALDEELYRSNEQVRRICDELAQLSRLGLAWEVLNASDGLLHRLDPRIALLGYQVGQEASPIPLAPGGDPAQPPPPIAPAPMSDIAGGIRDALSRVGRQPVTAMILFSDGRHVGGNPVIPAGLLPSGVPIFTVYTASPRVRDLAIDRVDLPGSIFVGETLTARVRVRNVGIAPGDVTGAARLTAPGAPPATQPITRADSRTLAPVGLKLRIDQPGPQRLAIDLPPIEGEASFANNHAVRWVKVLSQKLKVTALASTPGERGHPEFQLICDSLSRTPSVELRSAVVAPSLSPLEMSPEEIAAQDLVILHDVSPDALSADQWNAIRRLVAIRGGSVIIIPGPSFSQAAQADHSMADLLPYDPARARLTWRTWPGQDPHYHLAPASGAEGFDALRLYDDPERSMRQWDEMAGFHQYLSIDPLKPAARVLLEERELHEPLLVEHPLGAGRTLFFAMSETWRWRLGQLGHDPQRFWLQLVRYAVDEPYSLARGPLAFDADRFVAAPGEPVRLRARLTALESSVMPNQLRVAAFKNDQFVRTINLAGDPAAGRYSASVGDLPEGTYELRLMEPEGSRDGPKAAVGKLQTLSLPLTIEPDSEAELTNLSGDRVFLQQLAEATGGRFLTIDQVATLPRLLEEARLRQPRQRELPLWQSPYLFLFVLGCLAAEWSLRKHLGLA